MRDIFLQLYITIYKHHFDKKSHNKEEVIKHIVKYLSHKQ